MKRGDPRRTAEARLADEWRDLNLWLRSMIIENDIILADRDRPAMDAMCAEVAKLIERLRESGDAPTPEPKP